MCNIDKKLIQKTRMIKYFVDATVEIIDEEGYKGVTIRKVADKAGYNSATIYNYFESLDHLIFFASMTYLKEYIDDIVNYIYYAKNSIDIYLGVWDCFIDHSFDQPETYYNIFFANLKKDTPEYIKSYYSYFPLEVHAYPKEIQVMLKASDISRRSGILMEAVVEEGLIDKKRAELADSLIICVYESLLLRVKLGSIQKGVAKELATKYMEDIIHYMKEFK